MTLGERRFSIGRFVRKLEIPARCRTADPNCQMSGRLEFRLAIFAGITISAILAPTLLASEPTEVEQYFLELINRARANPEAEADRYNIDLNEGLPAGTISSTPKQPVAFNFNLIDSTRDHSQWMLDQDLFQHAGEGGSTPSQRAAAHGYTLNAPWGVGENLAWQGTTNGLPDVVQTTASLHAGLFVDEGIADRGHRTNMLAGNFKEIGVGILTGTFLQNSRNYNSVMISADFAYRAGNAFLTGVVFEDLDLNNFYSPSGEGYDDIAIRAQNTTTGASYETFTFNTGGYSLQLPPGTYRVTYGGEQLLDTTFVDVVMGGQNVKLDLINSESLRPYSNTTEPLDVNRDGNVDVQDIGLLVDDLNRFGPRELSQSSSLSLPLSLPTLFSDVNRDNYFTSADILPIIDEINRRSIIQSPGSPSGGGLLSFVETSEFSAVPEPASLGMATTGFLVWLTIRRRRGMLVQAKS